MEAYDGVAQIYEFRRKTEPLVLLIKDLFRQSKEAKVNADGTPIVSHNFCIKSISLPYSMNMQFSIRVVKSSFFLIACMILITAFTCSRQ